MPQSIIEAVYPETRFFGFTRCDGTTYFLLRVQALLRPDDVVLDVGCGRGQRRDDSCEFRRQIQYLGNDRRKIIGIDVDPSAAANPFIHEFRLLEDTSHWPIADSSIDVVYSDYVLEHVADPDAFFGEANRILKPGGYICLRTPNFFNYGAMMSWLIPNRLHAKLLAQTNPDCKSYDVFPTLYRCNSRRKIRKVMAKHAFEAVVYSIEGEPGYLTFFSLAYRLAAIVNPYLPSAFKSNLLAFGRKSMGR
jgi:ubiquinone/menaquinone biosynthesis C-methylase UbiE